MVPYQPAYWSGEDIGSFIREAGELVRPGPEAQRRVLVLENPGVPFSPATHTLYGNVQMVLPGEVAPSHRHTSRDPLHHAGRRRRHDRDGEPVEMKPGDLVLTPGWCWHGHVSQAKDRCCGWTAWTAR